MRLEPTQSDYSNIEKAQIVLPALLIVLWRQPIMKLKSLRFVCMAMARRKLEEIGLLL